MSPNLNDKKSQIWQIFLKRIFLSSLKIPLNTKIQYIWRLLYIKKNFYCSIFFCFLSSTFLVVLLHCELTIRKTCPVMDIIIIILGKLTLFSNWKTLHWFLRLLFFSLFFTNKKKLDRYFYRLDFFSSLPSLFIIFKFFYSS